MESWLSILPPFLAIAVAIWKKEVVLSLTVGIWSAHTILANFNPLLGFIGMLESCVAVFQSQGNTRILLFGLLVGALLEIIKASGGVAAFVRRLSNLGLTHTPRQAGMLATITGSLIFVDTNMSCLSAGVVSQNLFDRFKMSRARLAFILDATSAPISVLVLINGWGAYILGLIEGYGFENHVQVMAGSIAFNFYPLLILAMVWYTVLSKRVHGSLRTFEQKIHHGEVDTQEHGSKARYMAVPLVVMVLGMVALMWYTGDGNIMSGSGSKSVLWAVAGATAVAAAMCLLDGVFTQRKVAEISFKGMGKLLPLAAIMLLSFSLGDSCKALGTGPFVAGLVGEFLPPILLAPLLFIAGGIISFTTGTSWGTFAILIPIGLPLATGMGIPPSFALAAILGGGVFGDHCSPISDTTLVSSLAAGCDHLDHVKTQMPYALAAGSATLVLYILVGLTW